MGRHNAVSTVIWFALAEAMVSSASARPRSVNIDRVLGYSTYFGGSGDEIGMDIAIDGQQNAYVTGTRPSVRGSDFDAFVAKFSPAGSLLWVTDLGDRCDDLGRGIAVDLEGNAYVTGQIGGICFPYPDLRPGAFVAKLDTNGSLLYLLAFSGEFSGTDIGQAVAVDAAGQAYVAGYAGSAYLPTTPGAFQPTYGGWGDGFVVKVNAEGSGLVYATYLGGGQGSDSCNGIAVDNWGNAYLTGKTESRDFPTTPNAFQRTHRGLGPATTNGFVSKLTADGSTLLYSSYFGGRFNDLAVGVAVDVQDAEGNVYLTGEVESDDFPTTPGAVQPNPGDDRLCFFRLCTDAFVAKINTSAEGDASLVYSTYLGGNLWEGGSRIAVDASGSAYLTGYTSSADFPTSPDALQPTGAGGNDAFVAKLNPEGSALVYSSYLGGGGDDFGIGVAVDAQGNVYATGVTYSPEFPVTPDAYQPDYGGGADAFVTKTSAK